MIGIAVRSGAIHMESSESVPVRSGSRDPAVVFIGVVLAKVVVVVFYERERSPRYSPE